MAQRYGGKYSPDGDRSSSASATGPARPRSRARVSPVGARSNILFIPAIVLIATTFWDGANSLAIGLLGAGVWTIAAWLTREGLKAEDAYHARKVAKRPAIPRKIFGAGLVGVGTFLAASAHDVSLSAAALYGIITTALHITAFGLDPLRDKGAEGVDQFQQDRVAKVVDEAEAYLREMADAVRRAQDRQVEARVERFAGSVREMLRTVEEDPRDLTAARRYLGVYLMGARDASVKFADIFARSGDAKARSDYMMLLTDMEENYIAKTAKLLSDSNADLAIEIDVLRDRLSREGVRLD
ncbi:5-bromo-4-chloroindolyl phosphate hydrolysis family protein [Primorskyibacter sp. S187A]|uniref:5-bromo-4-chloroindolyl phosphate hydrolysis family protein n=1 Tax=Primorskyibacter sp. S187A TaxID=3415130 RepID=UPI003C79E1F9